MEYEDVDDHQSSYFIGLDYGHASAGAFGGLYLFSRCYYPLLLSSITRSLLASFT